MINTGITFLMARQIAQEEALRRQHTPRLSRYEFGPIVFDSENDLSWLFVSASEQLQNEGCIPGALFVRIDKRDGHIWSDEETEQYYTARAARAQTEIKPARVAQ